MSRILNLFIQRYGMYESNTETLKVFNERPSNSHWFISKIAKGSNQLLNAIRLAELMTPARSIDLAAPTPLSFSQ